MSVQIQNPNYNPTLIQNLKKNGDNHKTRIDTNPNITKALIFPKAKLEGPLVQKSK